MESVRELRKRYCPPALLVAILIGLLLVLLGYRDLARGLVLGTLFSIVNFVLMGSSIQLRTRSTRALSSIIAFLLVMMRFALLAIPLVVALQYDRFHIVTTIAGLFMVQAVVLTEALGKRMISSQR